jgi:hypothetical protein
VADGVPYVGDQPAEDLNTDGETGTTPDDPAVGGSDADHGEADEPGAALPA